MITDKQRREVARKLREPKESLLAHPDEELIRLRYETGCQRGQNIYEHLADLIDRETCRNASGYKDVFECSECRCKVEIVGENCNECGEVFSTPLMLSFCPNCGAMVVEDD